MHLEDALVGPRLAGDDLRVGTRLGACARAAAAAATSGLRCGGFGRGFLGRRLRLGGILRTAPDRIVRRDDALRRDPLREQHRPAAGDEQERGGKRERGAGESKLLPHRTLRNDEKQSEEGEL